MRIANKGGAVLAVLALLLAPVGVAYAQLTSEPVEGFAGRHSVDAFPSKPGPISTLSNIIVYDNTTSPALFGFSSTDLAAQFGDELFTTGTGLLSGMVLSLFNSGSSLGPVLTANLGVDLFDGVTSAPLGSFTVNVNFGTGLPPGFFSLITVTNLDPLAINLGVTDVIAIQSVISKTGAASRLCIVSFDPPSVGASPAFMFINALTVGPAGFYNIAAGPANPGYQVSVAPPPVGTKSSTWGQLKQLYR